jgi:hypothetical protein
MCNTRSVTCISQRRTVDCVLHSARVTLKARTPLHTRACTSGLHALRRGGPELITLTRLAYVTGRVEEEEWGTGLTLVPRIALSTRASPCQCITCRRVTHGPNHVTHTVCATRSDIDQAEVEESCFAFVAFQIKSCNGGDVCLARAKTRYRITHALEGGALRVACACRASCRLVGRQPWYACNLNMHRAVHVKDH